MTGPAPVGGRIWNRFTIALAALIGLAIVVLGARFYYGLGAVTNLNDGYPWGLWIAFDVVVGSALGAGGFTVAFMTYILNRGEYHRIIRPALVAALFGYVQATLAVIIDVGRYWDVWHVIVPRYAQVNSVLFEVAVCIMSYTIVLFIEFTPVVLEKLGWTGAKRRLEKVLFFFIAIGVVLPTMHQSSLGTVLVVFGPQVDPIYQTNLLPILFLVSCIGMGLATVVVEGTVSALALARPFERELLGKLMRIGQILAATFLVARFVDLGIRGALPLLFTARAPAVMFWIETALFLTPVLLLGTAASRRDPQRLFVSALTMALGGIVYRLSAYLVAYDTGTGWTYFPSMGEIVVTIGLVAAEILAFIVVIKLLPVLPPARGAEHG